jgi:fructosamine-3-kinase
VQVAQVVSLTDTALELVRYPLAAPAPGAGEALGRALAITHALGAPRYGAPPPAWSGPGAIGKAPLTFTGDEDRDLGWGEFYGRLRLLPSVKAAIKAGSMPDGAADVFGALAERLASGDLDSAQPGRVRGVARIHGDLWAGNILWQSAPWPDREAAPGWTGAILIDPAAQGGHAETDLAMLALFGAPHLDHLIEGYESISPLAPDWPERVALHQLHPLVVHAVLFGPSYGERAMERAARYL